MSISVFLQKRTFNVSKQEGRPVSRYRLALTGTRTAPLGSAEDVR